MDTHNPPPKHSLSPLPVRLLAWALLVAIALGSIWLIDRRAMMRNEITPTVRQPLQLP
jgi:hypothetical protein